MEHTSALSTTALAFVQSLSLMICRTRWTRFLSMSPQMSSILIVVCLFRTSYISAETLPRPQALFRMMSGLLLALSRPAYLTNARVKHLMMLIPVLEPNVVSGCIVLRECVVVRYFVVPRSPADVLSVSSLSSVVNREAATNIEEKRPLLLLDHDLKRGKTSHKVIEWHQD